MLTSIHTPLPLQSIFVNSAYAAEMLRNVATENKDKVSSKISTNKTKRSETKKSEKEFDIKVSDETVTAIKEIAKGKPILAAKMTNKAMETNKLLQFALYYMTNENAKLIEFDDSDKEFINGVAKYFGFGKIYDSVADADLQVFDPKSDKFNSAAKYLISLSYNVDIYKKDDMFLEKLTKRKEQLASAMFSEKLANHNKEQSDVVEEVKTENAEENHSFSVKKNDEDIIHPIFFEKTATMEPDAPVRDASISDEVFVKLEKDFGAFLKDTEHRYESHKDLIYLFVKDEKSNSENIYTVDTGSCMGKGKTYIMANIPNDRIFVSVEDHPEIVKKILDNVFYCLEAKEIQEVISDYFRNMNIYRYLDMNNTEFLNDISGEDFQKLGKKLTFIIAVMKSDIKDENQIPRLRFKSWENIDKFMLISDSDAISPLIETGETAPITNENIIFEVHGDDIVEHNNGTVTQYTIEHYGEM